MSILSLKNKSLSARNSLFRRTEQFFLILFSNTRKLHVYEKRLVVFTPRAGRGLKKSEIDDIWLRTLPANSEWKVTKLQYNSRVWILNTIRLLLISKMTKNLKIVLIQYVVKFHHNPSLMLLEYCQKNGAIVVKCWMDSYSDALWNDRILAVSNIGSLNIIADVPQLKKSKFEKSNKYVFHPVPIATFEYTPFQARKNLVYYSGGISSSGLYQSRKEYLDFLNQQNIPVAGVSYLRDKPAKRLTYDEYRFGLSNSKIGLNFTWKNEFDVIVTRTWEILSSGVLLLQNKSNVLNGLLESGTHFLEFSTREEMLSLIMEIKSNTQLAQDIALNGQRRYLELYDSGKFWENILYNWN